MRRARAPKGAEGRGEPPNPSFFAQTDTMIASAPVSYRSSRTSSAMNPTFFATDLHDDRQRTRELPIVTNELPNEPWGLRTDRHEDRERIRELPSITEKQCHPPLALRLNLHTTIASAALRYRSSCESVVCSVVR